jgi:PqqD family protein of HPr-rel-A system
MILRLCELSFLRWQHLGDEWVVFNEGCGETAVADPLTATILMALEPGPLEQNALMAQIAEDFQIADHEQLRPLVMEKTETLLQMGWIESET